MKSPRLPRLEWLVVLLLGLLPVPLLGTDSSQEDDDEEVLKKANVASDSAGLLEFLRHRSLTDTRRKELEKHVEELGSNRFNVRQRATRALIRQGTPALPFLRRALEHPDVEVVRRARECIEQIGRGPGPNVAAAAVRLLARKAPAKAVETLLFYLPYADNEAVAEEVLNALFQVSRKGRTLDSAVMAALADPLPARRGAAAYVVGRSGDGEQRAPVRRLLADADPKVRFLAAYGLAAGKDKEAVPVLIALVNEGPDALAWQAADLLSRIAGDRAPRLTLGRDKETRRKAAAAWVALWQEYGPKADWGQLELGQPGGAVVAELESNTVWESGPGGKARWELEDLQSPYDVQVLANGRILVAEYTGQRVTERDRQGKVHWEKAIDSPVACRRGLKGNTFIATTRGVLEITSEGKEVFSFTVPQNDCPVYGACRLWENDTAYIGCQGGLLRLDLGHKPLTAKKLPAEGEVSDVQGMPNGHLLVTLARSKQSKVVEVDAQGKTLWEVKLPHVTSATRLANGNVLAASSRDRRLVQVDAAGKVLWEKATAGRPVRVQRR
jgi:HEAT repeat protein